MARAFQPFINEFIFGAQQSPIHSTEETTAVQASFYELYNLSNVLDVVLVCLMCRAYPGFAR